MKILLCAAAVFAVLAVSATAATTPWKLSKRAHTTGGATAHVSNTISKPKGLAISAKSTPAQKLTISYSVSCSAGGTARPKITTGSFTSQGLGSQVPVKMNATNPVSCTLSASAFPPKGGSLYLSLWRR